MQPILDKAFKYLFVISLLACIYLYLHKDELPEASFYDLDQLSEPRQYPTGQKSFKTGANGEEYLITPRYDYELDGVIVSYHNADDFMDITHHRRWKDFINLRDLCVVWGSNVASGVYREMDFHNGTWTCWYSWPNSEAGNRFEKTQLSNNHVLIDDENIKVKLMQSEPGDHIRLKGMLVEYSNPDNGFHRGTSTTRTDTGNGACETIYITDFEVVKKANQALRSFYPIAFWTTIISLLGMVVMFVIMPFKGRYAQDV
jgi:hypothetical protein